MDALPQVCAPVKRDRMLLQDPRRIIHCLDPEEQPM